MPLYSLNCQWFHSNGNNQSVSDWALLQSPSDCISSFSLTADWSLCISLQISSYWFSSFPWICHSCSGNSSVCLLYTSHKRRESYSQEIFFSPVPCSCFLFSVKFCPVSGSSLLFSVKNVSIWSTSTPPDKKPTRVTKSSPCLLYTSCPLYRHEGYYFHE